MDKMLCSELLGTTIKLQKEKQTERENKESEWVGLKKKKKGWTTSNQFLSEAGCCDKTNGQKLDERDAINTLTRQCATVVVRT